MNEHAVGLTTHWCNEPDTRWQACCVDWWLPDEARLDDACWTDHTTCNEAATRWIKHQHDHTPTLVDERQHRCNDTTWRTWHDETPYSMRDRGLASCHGHALSSVCCCVMFNMLSLGMPCCFMLPTMHAMNMTLDDKHIALTTHERHQQHTMKQPCRDKKVQWAEHHRFAPNQHSQPTFIDMTNIMLCCNQRPTNSPTWVMTTPNIRTSNIDWQWQQHEGMTSSLISVDWACCWCCCSLCLFSLLTFVVGHATMILRISHVSLHQRTWCPNTTCNDNTLVMQHNMKQHNKHCMTTTSMLEVDVTREARRTGSCSLLSCNA